MNLVSLESHDQVEYYDEKYFGKKEVLKLTIIKIEIF